MINANEDKQPSVSLPYYNYMKLKENAEKWDLISKDLEVEEAKNTLIVEQIRKLLGNTTKNPEHCCQAFEYIRDTLQKIVREKND